MQLNENEETVEKSNSPKIASVISTLQVWNLNCSKPLVAVSHFMFGMLTSTRVPQLGDLWESSATRSINNALII